MRFRLNNTRMGLVSAVLSPILGCVRSVEVELPDPVETKLISFKWRVDNRAINAVAVFSARKLPINLIEIFLPTPSLHLSLPPTH